MAEGAPIIPIFAQLKYNIEVVCEDIRYHQENPRASQRLHQRAEADHYQVCYQCYNYF